MSILENSDIGTFGAAKDKTVTMPRELVGEILEYLEDARCWQKTVIERFEDSVRAGEGAAGGESHRIGLRTRRIESIKEIEKELRALLAAPVVERQPVAEWCDPLQLKTVIKGVIARERMRPASLPDSEVADAVYAAITEHLPVYEDVYDQLSEMIEPHVKRPYRPDAPFPASVVDSMGFLLKAYTSPPAPVAVRITLQQVLKAYDYAESHPHKYLRGTTNWCAAVAHELNACLDKVKELNQ